MLALSATMSTAVLQNCARKTLVTRETTRDDCVWCFSSPTSASSTRESNMLTTTTVRTAAAASPRVVAYIVAHSRQ